MIRGFLGGAARQLLRQAGSPRVAVLLGEPLFWLLGMRGGPPLRRFSEAKRVLVIRLDEIGDVVMTTPFLRETRRSLPGAWITLLVKPSLHNLVERSPFVDEVLVYEWDVQNRFPETIRTLRALRLSARRLWKRRFDLAVIPRRGMDLYHASWVAYLSGASARIGFKGAMPSDRRCERFFTASFDEPAPLHSVKAGLSLLEWLGGAAESDRLELWLDPADEVFAEQFLAAQGVSREETLVAVAAGGRYSRKRWPADRYGEVIGWLRSRYAARSVLVGGPEDQGLVDRIAGRCGGSAVRAAGQTTLRQAAALIKRCRLYVGNDTGLKHIAAAGGIPVVEISWHPKGSKSPESPRFFSPWGVPHAVLQPERSAPACADGCDALEPHCILGIAVEDVKRTVERMLGNAPC